MTPERSRAALALGGVLALALAVRLAHWVDILRSNLLQVVTVYADMGAYWKWAHGILGGDLLGRDTFHPHFPWMDLIAPMETWYRW